MDGKLMWENGRALAYNRPAAFKASNKLSGMKRGFKKPTTAVPNTLKAITPLIPVPYVGYLLDNVIDGVTDFANDKLNKKKLKKHEQGDASDPKRIRAEISNLSVGELERAVYKFAHKVDGFNRLHSQFTAKYGASDFCWGAWELSYKYWRLRNRTEKLARIAATLKAIGENIEKALEDTQHYLDMSEGSIRDAVIFYMNVKDHEKCGKNCYYDHPNRDGVMKQQVEKFRQEHPDE